MKFRENVTIFYEPLSGPTDGHTELTYHLSWSPYENRRHPKRSGSKRVVQSRNDHYLSPPTSHAFAACVLTMPTSSPPPKSSSNALGRTELTNEGRSTDLLSLHPWQILLTAGELSPVRGAGWRAPRYESLVAGSGRYRAVSPESCRG